MIDIEVVKIRDLRTKAAPFNQGFNEVITMP
jgi:hypothetical protein